jgi:hypothetical protein
MLESTLFLNALNLCSSLNVTDQVPHLYRTHIIIFFGIGSRQTKDCEMHGSKLPSDLIFMYILFYLVLFHFVILILQYIFVIDVLELLLFHLY